MLRLFTLFSIALTVLGGCQAARPFDLRTDIPSIASPPGVRWLRDSLFLDEAEITNIAWLEYLFHVRRDSGEAFYLSQLPDSASWISDLGPDDLYVQHYLRYPGFRHFPALGLSQSQAIAYCQWRSDIVNNRWMSMRKGWFEFSARRRSRRARKLGYMYKVEYRLPTEVEWQEAATDAEWPHLISSWPPNQSRWERRYNQPRPIDSLRLHWLKMKGITVHPDDQLDQLAYHLNDDYWLTASRRAVPMTIDDKKRSRVGLYDDSIVLPQYVYWGPPSGRSLYNIIGNVAEMTATPGVAKGGSFKHTLAEAEPSQSQAYAGPCSWVGFRCACVVHVRPLPSKKNTRKVK